MRRPVRRRLDRIELRLEKISRSLPRDGEGELTTDQKRLLRETAIEYVGTLFEVVSQDKQVPPKARKYAKASARPLLSVVK